MFFLLPFSLAVYYLKAIISEDGLFKQFGFTIIIALHPIPEIKSQIKHYKLLENVHIILQSNL